MAKLTKKAPTNTKSRYTVQSDEPVYNRAGGDAFNLDEKSTLVTAMLTSFFNEPKYYGDTDDNIINSCRSLVESDPEFVAKCACYARNEFHMRTVSHVIAAEVAKGAKGNPIVRKMINKVIERPDDITNILSYYLDTFGERKENPITRGLRRGIADVFPRFSEYHLAKYKGIKNKVKLRDALLIARPKPKDEEQAKLWKRLITNTLKVPETRETVLSQKGQSKKVWEDLIRENKLGYMAILRNLKNILENKVDKDCIIKIANILKNPERVKKSKQLPFRFYSAYKMIQYLRYFKTNILLAAVEEALILSFSNIPELKGNTVIICDESGSMEQNVSQKSMIRMIDIGNLLSSMADKFCQNSIIIPFGTRAVIKRFQNNSSVFSNMKELQRSDVGHCTNLDKALELVNTLDEKVDRIIIFSDMQCYNYYYQKDKNQKLVDEYRRKNNPNLWIHSFNLSGYGTTNFMFDKKTNLIAGWSEKILEYISLFENSGIDLINTIENYDI